MTITKKRITFKGYNAFWMFEMIEMFGPDATTQQIKGFGIAQY